MLLISAPLFDPGGLDKRIPAQRPVVPLPDNKSEAAPLEAAKAPEATFMNAGTAMRAALQEAARARTPVNEPPRPTDPTLAKPEIPLPDHNLRKEPTHNPLLETMGSGLENLLAKCFRRTDAEFEKLRVDLAKIDPSAVKQSISDFDSGRMLDRLRLLPMPMVIVHGTDDQVIQQPDENVWNYLTKDREDTLVPVPLPGVRHFPMLEAEVFQRLMNEFLDIADISKMEVKERWKRRTR
jgi:pimeloyl-ACP methyl ester carboxylesterase